MDLWYNCKPSDVRYTFYLFKQYFGKNRFVFQNKVVVWDKEISHKLLLNENGRGSYLGATNLISSHLPYDEEGNMTGLLTMGGLEIRKNFTQSDHTAYRNALLSFTTSPDCFERAHPQNATMVNIISKFEQEIHECDEKAKIGKLPLQHFLIRSLHWSIFELDLTDEEVKLLYKTHNGDSIPSGPVLWHVWVSGTLLPYCCCYNQESLYKKAANIYYRSPKLQNW
jgi:hypothetical protein